MKKANKINTAHLIVTIFIFVNVVCCTIWAVIWGPTANPNDQDLYGLNFFRPFTTDSNVFMGIVAGFCIIYLIKNKNEDCPMPRWLHNLYLAANICLVLTFATVVFFLAPKEVLEGRSYFNMFVREGIFFHFLNPVFSTVGIVALTKGHKYNMVEKIACIAPMAIYAVVYLVNVAVLHTWRDFYGFTFGGQYQLIPIVMIVMFTVTFLISLAVSALHNHFDKVGQKQVS